MSGFKGTDVLSVVYLSWCWTQKLEPLSADELILHEDLTDNQRYWLTKFIAEWDKHQSSEDLQRYDPTRD